MPYGWIQTDPVTGKHWYYHTDNAVGASCNDEAAENDYRSTVTIASWEDDDD